MNEKVAGERAPGRLLGRGRDTDVYDLGDGRVLRRYRTDYDHTDEIAAMAHLHAHGYPVPRLYSADGRDMVLERVDGPTMLQSLIRKPWRAGRYARLLADLHRRLHTIAPPPGLCEASAYGPPETVLHMDLHPDNVLLSPAGPYVIDWSNATAGPAGADLAQTCVIMAVAQADVPLLARPALALIRRGFLRAFRRAAHTDPGPYVAAACRDRLDNPNVTPVEVRRLVEMLEST
jgi:aminoglycoside phosphotransferase (APT) family kinase protein